MRLCKWDPDFVQEMQKFLDLHRAVCDFSLDQEDIAREKLFLPRPAHIEHAEFFEKLYVERPEENMIIDSLKKWPRMILVVGERGSGKTSIAYRVKEKMEKDHNLVMIFDARRGDFFESQSLDQISPSEISALMLKGIKSRYLKEIFTYSLNRQEEVIEPLFRLIEYIMENYNKLGRLTGYNFGGVLFPLYRRYRQYKRTREEATILEWLEENFDTDDKLADYIWKEIVNHPRLKPSLLIHAAHDVFKYKRQCIWIDNVDGLSYKQQARIQTSLKRLAGSISSFANVVVSVRSENILILDEFDEEQAPPRFMKVYLYLQEGFQDIALREAHSVPPLKLSWEIMKQIVQRRIELSFEKTNIDKEVKEQIRQTSFVILDAWRKIHITELANHSIRYLLAEHTDFLKYVCKFSDYLSGKTRFERERDVLTMYFVWLGSMPDNLRHMRLLDIVGVANKWHTRWNIDDDANSELARDLLPLLLLSSIWNFSLKEKDGGQHTRPTVEEILNVVAKIDIPKDDVLRVMCDTQSWINEDIPPLIEIQSPDQPVKIIAPSQIKEHYIISLSPRGKAMLRYILNTFGYFWGALHYRQMNKDNQNVRLMEQVLRSTEEAKWRLIRVPLLTLGKMYLCFLALIRNKWYPGPKWFEEFLADFGVPVPDYWEPVGIKINKKRRALQYEIMLTGIRNFFRNPTNSTVTQEIDTMLSWFKENLSALIKGGDLTCNPLLEESLFIDERE
ncbi:MAG: ATP-binding protein [Gammaproteobacteria bacterium]|nr:ATP-binding protein [Gammaproteobacteria bacterium]